MNLKALFVAGALALAFLLPGGGTGTAPAFADTVAVTSTGPTPPVIASTPEAVTAAKEDTSATIEAGNMLIYAMKALSAVFIAFILGAATWASRFLPGMAGIGFRWAVAHYGEKVVQNLTDYAVNAVAGATKDKKLEVNVGSSVVAAALERALTLQNEDRFLKWLIGQLGGVTGIGEKVFRKIDLEEGASKAAVLQPAIAAANRFPMKR